MVLALTTVTAVLGDSLVRGLVQPVHRPGAGAGRHRPADRPGPVHHGRARAARRHRHRRRGRGPVRHRRDALRRRAVQVREGGDLRSCRLGLDERRGLGALLEALAARHRSSASRSAPCRPAAARSRPSSPTWSRSGWPRTPRSSARARSRPWPAPRPPTTPPSPAPWRRCCRWACRPRPRPRSCWPRSSNIGLQPGPLLFDSNPELVWGLIASLYIGNVLLLVLNLPMAGVWVKLLHIPRPWLYAGILVFATMGAYTLNNNVVDLMILWIIGILGFGMRVLDVPVAPCVVGPDPGPPWPSSSSAARCRSARATPPSSSPTRSRSCCSSSRCCW